jgi:hypothetical protein
MNSMMKKLVRTLPFAMAAMVSSYSALADTSMWKVSKGNDFIYLGGTVHLLPPSAFPLPEEFDVAYKAADTLVFEAKTPEPGDNQAQIRMMQAFSYADGKRLSKVLSPEVYAKLDAYFKTVGVPLANLDGFKPAFVMLTMLQIEMKKAQLNGEGVDAHYMARAKKDNKTTQYLETLDEQIALLAGMGETDPDQFIQLQLEQVKDYKSYFNQLVAAWRAGDLASLKTLVVDETIKFDPKMYDDVFTKRNNNWQPKIERMFGNKERELVLVGAGHMAGPDGVLALLEKAGYKIEKM